MHEKHDNSILVIGYGNILRGDDGVGCSVAETVADWGFAWVRSIAVHQLLPELAADIAAVDLVIFVDAVIDTEMSRASITIIPLASGENAKFSTHIITPPLLLDMTQKLYNAVPIAYLLMIPARDFTLGKTLSLLANQGKDLALDYLRNVLQIHKNSGTVADLERYIDNR